MFLTLGLVWFGLVPHPTPRKSRSIFFRPSPTAVLTRRPPLLSVAFPPLRIPHPRCAARPPAERRPPPLPQPLSRVALPPAARLASPSAALTGRPSPRCSARLPLSRSHGSPFPPLLGSPPPSAALTGRPSPPLLGSPPPSAALTGRPSPRCSARLFPRTLSRVALPPAARLASPLPRSSARLPLPPLCVNLPRTLCFVPYPAEKCVNFFRAHPTLRVPHPTLSVPHPTLSVPHPTLSVPPPPLRGSPPLPTAVLTRRPPPMFALSLPSQKRASILLLFLNYSRMIAATAVHTRTFTAAMASRNRGTFATAIVFILEIIYGRLNRAVS